MPDPTPLSQAQHFVAHALRALYVLIQATEPDAPERSLYLDLHGAVYGVFIKLFPDETVRDARTLAIAMTGVVMKSDLDERDTLTVMQAIVEVLSPSRPGATDA